MADFERKVAVRLNVTDILNVELNGIEVDGRVDIILKKPGGEPNEISWIIDWEKKTIFTNLAAATGPQVGCVAACLIGASGAFADCLLKANSREEVWDCVDKNAVGAVFSALGCVLACF